MISSVRSLRQLIGFALITGCGARTALIASDSASFAAGGTPSDAGGTGSLGRAGHGAGGAGSGFAGGGGANAGQTGGGSAGASGGNAGASGGACSCTANERCCGPNENCVVNSCVCLVPRLVGVLPANARPSVKASEPVGATFSCAPDPELPFEKLMRVSGNFAGRLPANYPISTQPNQLLIASFPPDPLRRQAFFPGELVTGWLGDALGGPYQWQFEAAVRPKSSAHFTDTGQTLTPAMDAQLADLDHDGDLDLVTGSAPDHIGRVWSNDGAGNFSLAAMLPAFGAPLLGDIDQDGDVDIVTDHSYLNDGAFQFREDAPLGKVHALFDADGDGDLDVFAEQTPFRQVLLSNDGAGHFIGVTLGQGAIFDAQSGDLDNDGDLDLVLLELSTATPAVYSGTVLLNDGKGAFNALDAGLKVDASRSIALGDVDGDGDLDVLMGSWGAAGARNPNNQVWLNDGHAHFSAGDTPQSGSVQVLLADLDGDGDLDAMVGQHPPYSVVAGQPSQILLNDGRGRFTASGTLGGSNFHHLVVGDLDGDGDLDAVIAQWSFTTSPSMQVWLQNG